MPDESPAGSIVIPAHNEAFVVGSCLRALQPALSSGRFEVVVVSNGSVDGTVSVAERILHDAPCSHVVDLAAASKVEALREGDRVASVYPRLYLDADITVDASTVSALFNRLTETDRPRVGAPALHMETGGCSWAVRAYHRVWSQLPYVTGGVIGSGVYAVNRSGSERLGPFPDLLNDDEWVRRHFGPDEKVISEGHFTARAPRTIRALVRQRARTETGNADLVGRQPPSRDTSLQDLVAVARRSPRSAGDVAVYVAATVSARLLAAYRRRVGRSTTWSTDVSSRLARATSDTDAP